MSVSIHMVRVYRDEFGEIHAGRQAFVILHQPRADVRAGHVVTVIELEDETGDRTGRELRADVTAVREATSAIVAGIRARAAEIRA